VYVLPNFNLLADVWFPGHTPATDPADVTDVPCQLYIHSRFDIGQTAGDVTSWTPPIIFRMPTAAPVIARGTILKETSVGTGCYKVRWIQLIHVGFPNQYLVVLVEQCNDDGSTPQTY
jgi:hypothetical protein